MFTRFNGLLILFSIFNLLLFSLFAAGSHAADLSLPAPSKLPALPSLNTFNMKKPPNFSESDRKKLMPSLAERSRIRVPGSSSALKNPLEWPVYGQISSGFGMRSSGYHEGIDIPLPHGTPIRAARGGIVSESRVFNGYGKTIVLEHGDGLKTLYAHCSQLLVKKGDKVDCGALIALVGDTGRSTTTHLHFGVMVAGKFKDPENFLKSISPRLVKSSTQNP